MSISRVFWATIIILLAWLQSNLACASYFEAEFAGAGGGVFALNNIKPELGFNTSLKWRSSSKIGVGLRSGNFFRPWQEYNSWFGWATISVDYLFDLGLICGVSFGGGWLFIRVPPYSRFTNGGIAATGFVAYLMPVYKHLSLLFGSEVSLLWLKTDIYLLPNGYAGIFFRF